SGSGLPCHSFRAMANAPPVPSVTESRCSGAAPHLRRQFVENVLAMAWHECALTIKRRDPIENARAIPENFELDHNAAASLPNPPERCKSDLNAREGPR